MCKLSERRREVLRGSDRFCLGPSLVGLEVDAARRPAVPAELLL